MSQQVALSSFAPSMMIHKYREKIAYGESEEGYKFLARWEAEICPAKAKIISVLSKYVICLMIHKKKCKSVFKQG